MSVQNVAVGNQPVDWATTFNAGLARQPLTRQQSPASGPLAVGQGDRQSLAAAILSLVEEALSGRQVQSNSTQQQVSTMSAPQQSSQRNSVFPGLSYGAFSADRAVLLGPPNQEEAKKKYIGAYVPTTEAAGQLQLSGLANIFTQSWQEQVAQAATNNGGLGDVDTGYLAWSNNGFVRLKNSNLTDEQNRKIAEISLITGNAVENLPSRSTEPVTQENINRWVDTFIERHDTAMSEFLNNPANGYSVKDGSKRYGNRSVPLHDKQ